MSAQRKRSIWPVVLTIGVLGGAGWAAITLTGDDPSANRAIAGATAIRGPLKISVVERGNLEAADAVTLKSEIEGQSTVLYLIDEGGCEHDVGMCVCAVRHDLDLAQAALKDCKPYEAIERLAYLPEEILECLDEGGRNRNSEEIRPTQ